MHTHTRTHTYTHSHAHMHSHTLCLSLGEQLENIRKHFHPGSQFAKYKNYDSTGNWVSQAEVLPVFEDSAASVVTVANHSFEFWTQLDTMLGRASVFSMQMGIRRA